MKKQLLVILFILLPGLVVPAQTAEKTVENIRKYYATISEKARLAETDGEQGQYGDLVMNELVINKLGHQWRAVGIFRETYRFFYRGGDSEEHLYPDQLVMAKAERRSSSRTCIEEYVFDEAGRLIFYFQKAENDELTPAERRVYFSPAGAVRIIEDGKTRDQLTAKDVKTAAEIAATGAKIKEVFSKSIKL
jgi:hypothetical protein